MFSVILAGHLWGSVHTDTRQKACERGDFLNIFLSRDSRLLSFVGHYLISVEVKVEMMLIKMFVEFLCDFIELDISK